MFQDYNTRFHWRDKQNNCKSIVSIYQLPWPESRGL